MFRLVIILVPAVIIGVSCTRKQPALASQSETEYYVAVQDFVQSRIPLQGERAMPFILEDSVILPEVAEEDLRDSAIFTTGEQQQIRAWVKHPPFQVWTADLVHNANIRLIQTDTVEAIFKQDLGNAWAYVNKHIDGCLNTFSCPLFLRNYTWCLLYSEYICGPLAGAGQLELYKKEGGRWVVAKSWGSWIS